MSYTRNRMGNWLEHKVFIGRDAILLILFTCLALGLILGYSVGRDTVKVSYKYVNYCDHELPQNYTSSDLPTYNIAEFVEAIQTIELPFGIWVLVLLIIVVILK